MKFRNESPQAFLGDLTAPLERFSMPGHQVVDQKEFTPGARKLLVHHHHMTVTVEAYHGSPVSVRVLKKVLNGDAYTRELELICDKTGLAVLHGVVRIHLQYCKDDVRKLILAEGTPLGRILITHGVLTRIELVGLLLLSGSTLPQNWFQTTGKDAPGRLAVIYCDGKPAIELLEVIAPID